MKKRSLVDELRRVHRKREEFDESRLVDAVVREHPEQEELLLPQVNRIAELMMRPEYSWSRSEQANFDALVTEFMHWAVENERAL